MNLGVPIIPSVNDPPETLTRELSLFCHCQSIPISEMSARTKKTRTHCFVFLGNFMFYFKRNEAIEVRVNRTAIVIAILNIIFSPPRLVFLTLSTESLPPKAPPRDSSDCCRKIIMIRSTDNMICKSGKLFIIVFIYQI